MDQESISHHLPHVVIFPSPGEGHVTSMLKLAEVLSLSGLHITFLNFEFFHEKLVRYTDIQSRFISKYPGFQFKTIPDCMSMDKRSKNPVVRLRELLEAMKLKSKPIFKKMLIESTPPVDHIIGDMLMGFVHDAATEVGIPSVQFHTISACSFWVFHSVPHIVTAHQLPIKGEEDMDRLITAVPGMENVLRCRDLPKKFCQESQSLVLNTFEELEGPILSQIRTRYPKIYTIGPIHELLKTKLTRIKYQELYSGSISVREVDRSCMEWLDNQPSQSVLYVSFGSVTLMTREQVMEFWYGLVSSKKRFLWVIRPNSIINEEGLVLEKVPVEVEVGPKERGYIASWAPQEEVLSHKAIGGFMTHSGWNSTLESIAAGIPMICWPYYGDQQVNSRFVSEAWKLGLDMKDSCDREIIEKIVNDLMVNRREDFVKSTARMADLARTSVAEGGSSSCNLDRLIEEIRLMSMNDRQSP